MKRNYPPDNFSYGILALALLGMILMIVDGTRLYVKNRQSLVSSDPGQRGTSIFLVSTGDDEPDVVYRSVPEFIRPDHEYQASVEGQVVAPIFFKDSITDRTSGYPPFVYPIFLRPLPINKAGLDDIAALPGIGPKLAERILVFRDRFGSFNNETDLMAVKGIGRKKVNDLKTFISFQ